MESAPEMYERILKLSEFGNRLSLRTISCSECVLLDPKLMATFCRYYKNWSLETFLTAFNIAAEPAINDPRNGTQIADYYIPIQSFRTVDNFRGLRALWIWQCQKIAAEPGRAPWALRIEVMFNWVRFFYHYGSIESFDRLAKLFLHEAEAKYQGVIVPRYADLCEWLSVLSGVFCTIPVGESLQFAGRTSVSEIFKDPYHENRSLPIQSINSELWLEESEEFDAAFILSGPFKLSLTDNIMEHLTFSTANPQTLFIYYNDTQSDPGLSAIMFRDNMITDGFELSCIAI